MTQGSNTRMEKQVRNLGRAALLVGFALLIVITGMTARYGWNQTPGGWEDKGYQAALNGVIDLAGAVSAGMWGAFFAMRFRLAGAAVTLLTIGCAFYTYQAVIGFQSSSRETLAAARERASVMSNAYIDWAKSVTTKVIEGDKDKKGQVKTDALMTGIEAVGAQVTSQMKMLQSGDLVVSPDSQATTFARMLGVKEADARTWTITITSVLIIFIHYMSLWAYGFIRQRLEPAVSLLSNGPRSSRSPEKSGVLKDTVQKVRIASARQDVSANVDAAVELCNLEYARRWGVSESQASRWIKRIIRDGIAQHEWRGQRKVLVRSRKGLRVLYGGAQLPLK